MTIKYRPNRKLKQSNCISNAKLCQKKVAYKDSEVKNRSVHVLIFKVIFKSK